MSDENEKKDAPADSEVVDLSDFDTESDVDSAVKNLQAQLAKAQQDYLYLRADFDNYKKSAIKERSELLKYGSERFVLEFLSLVDTFDQALSMEITAENFLSFRQGIEMLRKEFTNSLQRLGVETIESMGQPFDPNVHEAISSEPTSEVPPGHICRVFKPAYKLHDRVIRPAQVAVATEVKPEA